MKERNKTENQSGDRNYFTTTPRLVWALSRSPYDYMLWSVIKDIAGENYECTLSTRKLAALSMMSVGKVSNCREYLVKVGLLKGHIEKEDAEQKTWVITVPDLWVENTEMAKKLLKIKERVKFKTEQLLAEKERCSSHEHLKNSRCSLHEQGHSPHEQGCIPGERGHAPHERSTYKEELKKNQRRDKEKAEAPFLESQIQKQEKPDAKPLPESNGGCAAPAENRAEAAPPTGSLRADSERPAAGVDCAGVGEDFPSWIGYVSARYGTHDRRAIEKHLRANDKGRDLTGDKVAAWCARCGTFAEWLRSNVDGTYAGKTNGRGHSNGFSGNGHSQKSADVKRLEPVATESKRPAPPVTSADRTREFFFDKVIPLDIQVHGKQTLWYNSTEHPKVFAMAWQCYWPEEEILKRLPRYWRSTNDFYRKAGYNLRLFFQNFDEFADQLTKTEMRYPMLSDVYAAQEQAAARNEA